MEKKSSYLVLNQRDFTDGTSIFMNSLMSICVKGKELLLFKICVLIVVYTSFASFIMLEYVHIHYNPRNDI